jgi:hypothetical protein
VSQKKESLCYSKDMKKIYLQDSREKLMQILQALKKHPQTAARKMVIFS